MIPNAYIQAWSAKAPWPDARQVEQDLIICRTLCDLFNTPALKGKIAFRGGTAINKLLFKQPLRYSEDIDLVQTEAEPIGMTIDGIRGALSWLGKCKREQAGHSMHMVFKFAPEADSGALLVAEAGAGVLLVSRSQLARAAYRDQVRRTRAGADQPDAARY